MGDTKRMFGGDIEVPGMSEESCEVCGDQPHQLLVGPGVTFFCRVKHGLKTGTLLNTKPPAPPAQEFAMTFEQLNARQPQRQTARPLKLFVCQHGVLPGIQAAMVGFKDMDSGLLRLRSNRSLSAADAWGNVA